MLVWERLLVEVIEVTFARFDGARSKGPAIELAMFSALAPRHRRVNVDSGKIHIRQRGDWQLKVGHHAQHKKAGD